jgi:hypothetical protein
VQMSRMLRDHLGGNSENSPPATAISASSNRPGATTSA